MKAGNCFTREQEERLALIALPLLQWYDNNRRILPWREEPTPYHVWVSEIMLQQTRVEAVKGYYTRFMQRLPDVESLAKASEDELLKLWEGLGYYNRVRNMQKAAQSVLEDYKGQIPADMAELLSLSGIGSYTAGAISSIAYGRRNPAVDGNVLRVVTRILASKEDIKKQSFRVCVEETLRRVMSTERPGDYNQAMMDIGATICVPNGEPFCEKCPFVDFCESCRQGTQLQYPVKTAPKKRRMEEKTVLVLQDQTRIALVKRPEKGLLAGLYGFPMLEGRNPSEVVRNYLKEHGIRAIRIMDMGEAKHIFSHIEWHMVGYHIVVDELQPFAAEKETDDTIFVEIEKIRTDYAIPTAFRAYSERFLKGFSEKDKKIK